MFCRFAGCNLWTGREQDRASAVCSFCDTDFVGTDGPGGGKFATAEALAAAVAARLGGAAARTGWWCCTGGEPLLQLDAPLIDALHAAGFAIALETNGTIAAPPGIDWICVSPKADAPLAQTTRPGAEAGLSRRRASIRPGSSTWLSSASPCSRWTARTARRATRAAIAYCLAHPRWRLSLQTHKYLGIP